MENFDFYRQATLPTFTLPTDPIFETPKQIGPYKIDTLLHKGSMSMLFLGRHPSSKEVLAIKILLPKLQTHEDLVKQFLEEAKIISIADHPNIVKLYGQGEWEKGLYIAMEFIQGVSLRQFIEGQSLSLKKSLDIILQVAYALLHLHTHGIIHRDLKPENILITENGKVKVIDFGIARLMEGAVSTRAGFKGIMGTPSYMSPEQKKNPESVTVATDIYALGVISYELIIGKLSFGNVQIDLLPKNLQNLIQKSLEPNVSDRYHDIVDFIGAISAYIRSNGIAKDRGIGDELKEVWQLLGEQHNNLLPKTLPTWPEMEIGLAKPEGVFLFGTYYDFFRLTDGSMCIILAESEEGSISHFSSITTLRGVIRALMLKYTYSGDSSPFVTANFAFKLNQVFANEPHVQNQAITILHLSPYRNEFAFVSSGFESIYHLSGESGRGRILKNESPMLGGHSQADFYATNDTWNYGDVILMHSFGAKASSKETKALIDDQTKALLQTNCNLASQKLAEITLTSLNDAFKPGAQKSPGIVFALTRMG